MYIGSTGPRGLHHLVWEVVDNAIDEAMAGHCTLIDVTLQKDGSVRVSDNGRGIPVGLHTQTRMSALTTVLTVLHAGGKFEKGSYQVSGGLHGVGVSVVNALSERLDAEVRREGRIWTQSFEKGLPMGKVEKGRRVARTGTTITFLPDTEIFQEIRTFSRATVASRLRELAYLNRNLQIKLTDAREAPAHTETFRYKGGIRDFVAHLNRKNDVVNARQIVVEDQDEDAELAFHDIGKARRRDVAEAELRNEPFPGANGVLEARPPEKPERAAHERRLVPDPGRERAVRGDPAARSSFVGFQLLHVDS